MRDEGVPLANRSIGCYFRMLMTQRAFLARRASIAGAAVLAFAACEIILGTDALQLAPDGGFNADGGPGPDSGSSVPPDAGRKIDAGISVSCFPDGGAPVAPQCTGTPGLSHGPPPAYIDVGETKSSGPGAVIGVDLNCDGFTDLAILDTEGSLQVLLGEGDGGFQVLPPTVTGASPMSLAAGDFTGQGHPDVAYTIGSSVNILIGHGDGTFATNPASFPVDPAGNGQGFAIAVGDVNGDKRLDLVIADNVTSGLVSVLLGNGDGTFQSPQSYPVGSGAYGVALADFNQDGQLDIAVSTDGPGASPVVSVLLNLGGGTFGPALQVPAPDADPPAGVVAADFNGDGRPDIAVVGTLSDQVDVMLAAPDGGFAAATPYAVPSVDPTDPEPFGLVLGDFNGDGILDLAVVNTQDGSAAVLLGNGNGGFSSGGAWNIASPGTNQPLAEGIAAWSVYSSAVPHNLAVTDATNGPNLDTGTVTLLENGCP
jgi:hypothetical protein